jgi:mono/diheme cytochrome c family protein
MDAGQQPDEGLAGPWNLEAPAGDKIGMEFQPRCRQVSIMSRLRIVALTLVASAVLGFFGGILFVYSGAYDPAALSQHSRVGNWLLHSVALNSIGRRAQGVKTPDLGEPAKIARGLGLYRRDCAQCHGAPGEAPAAFAMGLTPGAPSLIQVAREWPANEIYWAVKNGIKMTAMPSWRYRMSDDEIWDVVAFVETLPRLSPAHYRVLIKAETASAKTALDDNAPGVGDPRRGKLALEQYACAACHIIPGVIAQPGRVGPTLAGMGGRSIVAGLKPNTPEGMIEWIRHPDKVSPGTAMPDMGVGEQDARDMAAYLATL